MINVGIVGTSWWADEMYLPALKNHPEAKVVAVCGRDPLRTQQFAEKWGVPDFYHDYQALITSGKIEALIVAALNETHYPITMAALDAGLHVLCEKPLAITYAQAQEMTEKAAAAGVNTMVAFTHRYMPTTRYLRQLLDSGYIGKPYTLNMRYYSGGARKPGYKWKNDKSRPGAGVLYDLGSHWLHLARWFYGEITGLTCYMDAILTHEGHESADDMATMTVKFANGAMGILTVGRLGWEGNKPGQTQQMDFHGSDGTLYLTLDWDTVQQIRGVKDGSMGVEVLPVPESIWQGARRDTVMNTRDDVFYTQNVMAREFFSDIAAGRPSYPDFAEGARVQQLIEAAVHSAVNGCCWVRV